MIHIDINISGDKYLIVTQPLGGFDIFHVDPAEYVKSPRKGKHLIAHRSTVSSALRWLEGELCVDINDPVE